MIPLAPLHNGAHLTAFKAFKNAVPDAGNVAVFDTAFHQSMEMEDYLYAIPYEYYEKYSIRRYGAHGTSHDYLSQIAKETYLKNVEHPSIITLHIGSGSSLCAIKDGKCVATSMGLTPLAGVVMGTRCGDIDPSVMPYIISQTGKTSQEVYDIFNFQSGLKGISGVSNDTRDIEEAMEKGNERAIIAAKMFARSIANYIGQYYVRLGHVDLLVFSAGIGENSSTFRKLIVEACKEALGLDLDEAKNLEYVHGKHGYISTKKSKIPMVVIPTDEELMIAKDVVKYLKLSD